MYIYIYITLIARKLSEPDDGCYRPKHVVIYTILYIYTTLIARNLSKPNDGRYRPKRVFICTI